MELFGRAGKVVMVRICQPGAGPKTTAQLVYGADIVTSTQARLACSIHLPLSFFMENHAAGFRRSGGFQEVGAPFRLAVLLTLACFASMKKAAGSAATPAAMARCHEHEQKALSLLIQG